MKTLLQREWRLTRWPLLSAVMAQLTFLCVTSQRSYSELLETDPSWVALLFAAWIGYHRFYAEQSRGTWLLQPFSRTRLLAAKVLNASASLLLLALIESTARYGWVASSSAPGGPILSLAPFLEHALSVSLATAFAMLLATAIAAFAERRWLQVAGVAAGLAWVLVATPSVYQLQRLSGDWVDMPAHVWRGLTLLAIACLGTAALLKIGSEVGLRPSIPSRILSALWCTPLASLLLLLVMRFVPDSVDVPHGADHHVLLRDGAVVRAHFDRGGFRAQRTDGREVRLRGHPNGSSERVAWLHAASIRPFGAPQWSPMGEAFVAEDARSLLLYDAHSGAPTACFGGRGMEQGNADCAPGARVLSFEQYRPNRQLEGLVVATESAVHVLDTLGAHERYRGHGIQGAALLGDDDVLAVFTEGSLHITGRIERTCPHATTNALVGLLENDTVVALEANTLTYCGEHEVTSAPWPSDEGRGESLFNASAALFFPVAFDPYASTSTWWFAVLVRLLGGAIAIGIARKRGIAHALLGLILGPAYLLAAALVAIDIDIIAIWRQRILRESGGR